MIARLWLACAPPAITPAPSTPAPPAPAPALFPNGLGTVSTGAEDESAAACEVCHAAEHADWRTSRHASSWSNPVFRAAIEASRPARWCLNCHTPLEAQQEAIRAGRSEDALVAEGVNCAVCHVRGGAILGPRPVEDDWAHAVVATPEMSEAGFCAGCHQFNVPLEPVWPVHYGDVPLQDTVGEHARWEAAGGDRECQGCHDHRARGAHDVELVRGSVRVEARDDGPDLVLTLTADAGHRVPTGDPFRRIVVSAGERRATLARTFEPEGTTWVLLRDRTLGSEPIEVRLAGQAGADWVVEYRFGEERFEAELPPEEVGFVIARRAGTP